MENPEEKSIADILNESYDKAEAGEAAPEPEKLEFEEGQDPLAQELENIVAEPEPEPDTPTEPEKEPDAQAENDAPADPEPDPTDVPPSSWKREIAEKWNDLPKEVKDEIQRRETDYHKGIEQYKQYAGIGRDIERVISPHMETIQKLGVHPIEAIGTLLNADHKLRHGSPEQKAQYFGQLAQEYGIDLKQVQPPAPVDPAVLELRQQNQKLQRFQQSVMEQQNQQAMSEIEKFKANPENVHFESVKDDMALLLQSGKAESLQDAYDKAVWMRPDIRKSLVEQQRTEAEKKLASRARNQRAQSAAVGIKGSSPSKGNSLSPDASLRDTLLAAADGDL